MGKLVRDRIPDIIRRDGGEPVVMVLDEGEYRTALMEKLFEEAAELREASSEEMVAEIADVYEVLRALAEVNGYQWMEVEQIADSKREERGAFSCRLYLI